MNNHECIKCKRQYRDNDPDSYYCELCLIVSKKIAQELEKRFVPRAKEKSMLELYDEAPKVHGFVNAKDFMI